MLGSYFAVNLNPIVWEIHVFPIFVDHGRLGKDCVVHKAVDDLLVKKNGPSRVSEVDARASDHGPHEIGGVPEGR